MAGHSGLVRTSIELLNDWESYTDTATISRVAVLQSEENIGTTALGSAEQTSSTPTSPYHPRLFQFSP